MSFDATPILLVGGLALAAAVTAFRVVADQRRREGLVAMAARRGWNIEMQDRLTLNSIRHFTGRENRIVVTPRNGEGWRCEVCNWNEEGEDSNSDSEADIVVRKGTTDFFDPACPTPDGIAVTIGLPGSGEMGELIRQQAREAPGTLRRAAGSAAVPEGIALYSSHALPAGVDLPRIAAAAEAWKSRHGDHVSPILAWRGGGLRVRMDRDAIDAGRLEDFVQTALEMREAVRHAS